MLVNADKAFVLKNYIYQICGHIQIKLYLKKIKSSYI